MNTSFRQRNDLPPEDSPQTTPDKNLSRIGEGHPYYAIQQNQIEIARSIGDLTSSIRSLTDRIDKMERQIDKRLDSVEKTGTELKNQLNRIYWTVGGFLGACGLIFGIVKYTLSP